MNKYNNGLPVKIVDLDHSEYFEAAKAWSEGYNIFEEILNFCLNNNVPTIACCKGHQLLDNPYMTFIYNKDSRLLINGFLNQLKNIPGVHIMFATTGFTDNPFNVTVYTNMLNRDKVFNIIDNSLKNYHQSETLYDKLNACLRLAINLDYTEYGMAQITLYNQLFTKFLTANLNGPFTLWDTFDENKSSKQGHYYIYRSSKQLDIISDYIEKFHEMLHIGKLSISAFATTEQKVDGITSFNEELEQGKGTISRRF